MIWKTILTFKEFEVSDFGYIRAAFPLGMIMPQYINSSGYYEVTLTDNKRTGNFLVHRLVAETFHPNENAANLVVNHKDLYKLNNAADNLEWLTSGENIVHYHESVIKQKFGEDFLMKIKGRNYNAEAIVKMLQNDFINRSPISKILYPNNTQAPSALTNKILGIKGARLTESDLYRLNEIFSDFILELISLINENN